MTGTGYQHGARGGPDASSGSWRILALALLGALCLHALLHGSYAYRLLTANEAALFQGQPLMTSSDAYYFLYHSREVLEAAPGDDGPLLNAPPLSVVCARVQAATGLPLRTVAFWLPPALAVILLATLALYGRILSPAAAACALCAQVFAPYWFLRTRPGYFDTDCLNPLWFLLSLTCVYWFTAARGRRRLPALAAAVLACLGGVLWWEQVGYVVPAACVGAYALTVFFPSNPAERALKGLLLLAGAALALVVATGWTPGLPREAALFVKSLHEHAALALHFETGALPRVRVTELGGLTTLAYLRYVSGAYAPFVAGLVGLGLLAWRRRRLTACLAPMVVLGAMSVFSLRFLLFLIPVYALGLGFLLADWTRWDVAARFLRTPGRVRLAVGVTALALLAPAASYVARLTPAPSFDARQAAMATRIGELTSPDTMVWAPWSEGHFIRYFSRRPVFLDGGDIDRPLVFLSEAPLAMADQNAAADWIRFFAEKGRQGLFHPADRMRDLPRAVDFYRQVFRDRASMPGLVRELDLGDPEWWKGYLASGRRTVLFLDHLMLRSAPYWYAAATWDFATGRGRGGVVVGLDGTGGSPWLEHGLVRTPVGDFPFGEVLTVGRGPAARRTVAPGRPGAAVVVPGTDRVHVVGQEFLDSVYARLFILDPDGLSRFKKLHHDPLDGGLWEVLPPPPSSLEPGTGAGGVSG